MSDQPVTGPAEGATASAEKGDGCRASVTTPHIIVSARMPTPIHTPRAIVSRPMSRPMRARIHSRPISADGEQCRQVLGPHVTREAPSRDGRDRHAGHVVSDDDAGERAEEKTFDQCRRGREPGGARAECAADTAHKAAGNEQRPAFDVDGAHERGKDRRREHEPGG